MTITRAEVCIAACADTWRDSGEILVQTVGTIPAIASRLARLTFAPDIVLSDGEAFLMAEPAPLGRTAADGGVIESWVPFRSIFDILQSGRRQSMLGASQVDRFGNQNISIIGDWNRPTRQLIGVRGAPGNTVNHRVDYWVARQSARVFVEQVDLVSGVGHDRASADPASMRYHRLGVVVTNLAVFDYGPDGQIRVKSRHPGVTPEVVQRATGFPIEAADAPETRMPGNEELQLIREFIDPKGARNREVPD